MYGRSPKPGGSGSKPSGELAGLARYRSRRNTSTGARHTPSRATASASSASRTLLECPGGKVAPGESPEEAIRRELSEEVGLYPRALSLLGSFFTSVGTSTEQIYCFVAEDFEERTIRDEDRERMNIERFSVDALREMFETGIMADGKTEIALSRYLRSSG